MGGFLVNAAAKQIDAGNIAAGSVGASALADNAVTTPKIDPLAVTLAKIAASAQASFLDPLASTLSLTLAETNANQVGAIGDFYLADDFESDSLATKTNATFNANARAYTNQGAVTGGNINPTLSGYSGGGLTVSADKFRGAGYEPWRAFDSLPYDGTNQWDTYNAGSPHWAGILYMTYDTPKTIGRISLGKAALHGMGYMPGVFTFEGSPDAGSTWEVLGSFSVASAAEYTGGVQKEFDLTAPGTYTHYRLNVTDTATRSTNGIMLGSMQAFELDAPTNMTLAPTAVTLTTANPTDLAAWLVINPQETITAGTDITMTASIDGGTTDATGSWTKVGDVSNDGRELWRVDFDVSAQSGSSLTYEINTLNNKEIRVQDVVGIKAFY